jgi:VWFA-related protein
MLSVVVAALLGYALYAQQDPTFSTDVKVVNLYASVRNKQGQIVKDLTKDDFQLSEDGRPQTISYFAKESNLPLTLGLLVDVSGSQANLIDQERAASSSFFVDVLREDKDLAFVIQFARDSELLQDITSSHQLLQAALDSLRPPAEPPDWNGGNGGGNGRGGYPPNSSPGSWPGNGGGGWPGSGGGGWPGGGGNGRSGRGGPMTFPQRRSQGSMAGGTALYDSVYLASDEVMKKQSGRKALIILSDGVDNESKISLSDAIEAAQRANTIVYSILFSDPNAYQRVRRPFGGPMPGGGRGRWPGGPSNIPPANDSPQNGKAVLNQISKETGGKFFEVSKKEPLERIYATIQEELRNQYSLGYSPELSAAGAGYRRIRLTTKQKDMTVQTRDGYYSGAKTPTNNGKS